MTKRDDPLLIIEQIKAEEQAASNNVILSHKIAIKEEQLNRLKSEKEKLTQRLKSLGDILEIKQEKNNLLSENKKHMDRSKFSDRRTSFFRILRCLEAEIERETGRRDGMKSENNNLRGGVSEFTALRKRQMRQISQLKDQSQEATARTTKLEADVKAKAGTLLDLNHRLGQLETACEDVKERVKAKAMEMRAMNTEGDVAQLVTQKKLLEDSITEAKNKLQQLKAAHQKSTFQRHIGRKQQLRVMKEISSPVAWMSERTALIGKLKKAKADLEQLRNRERGMVRATETVEKKMQDLNYTDDEIKAAILSEMATFKTELSPFQIESLELEKAYHEELSQKLSEVLKSMALVEQYHQNVMVLLRRQDAVATIGDRIGALKNEWNALKQQM